MSSRTFEEMERGNPVARQNTYIDGVELFAPVETYSIKPDWMRADLVDEIGTMPIPTDELQFEDIDATDDLIASIDREVDLSKIPMLFVEEHYLGGVDSRQASDEADAAEYPLFYLKGV